MLAGVAAAAVLRWATAAEALGTGKWLLPLLLVVATYLVLLALVLGVLQSVAILAVAACLVLVGVVLAAFMVLVVVVLAEVLVPQMAEASVSAVALRALVVVSW